MAKSVGVICARGRIKHDDCRKCALRPDRPCDLTPDVLEWARGDTHEVPADTYTATMLLGCTRQEALAGQGGGDGYYVNIDNQWPAIRGSMVHSLMEKMSTYPGIIGIVREVRFVTQVQTKYGIKNVGGKPDCIVLNRMDEDGTLYVKVVDYKTTGEITHEKIAAEEDHQMQVNIYGWLCAEKLPIWLNVEQHLQTEHPIIHLRTVTRVVVEELEVFYGDMKKNRRFTSGAEREAPGKMVRKPENYTGTAELRVFHDGKHHEVLHLGSIHLLSPAETEAWVIARMETKHEAKQTLPPMLGEEKRWIICPRCPVREKCFQLAAERGEL